MRVVSLLPSATEVLCRLVSRQAGGLHGSVQLVGRSHECDFPASIVSDLPVLTSQRTTFTTPKDVDDQVRTALHSGESLYAVDEDLLQKLQPDVILTQSLCAVCSIDLSAVEAIVNQMSPPRPKIISLNPTTLSEMVDSLRIVGEGVGLEKEAQADQNELIERIERCKEVHRHHRDEPNTNASRPNIAFIEWTDPLYVGGHWTPELIQMAGGVQRLNDTIGVNSFSIPPEKLVEDDPDMVIVCPCGLDLQTTKRMVRDLERSDWWPKLRAINQQHKVAIVDGNQFFNRPGPRLVDCLEWLTWLLNSSSNPSSTVGAVKEFNNSAFAWEWYEKQEIAEGRKDVVGCNGLDLRKSAASGVGLSVEIEECHRLAVEQGKKTYIDPETGYSVFTELASIERGFCCGRGCRHCTYGHWNVKDPSLRKNHIVRPTLLRPAKRRRKDGKDIQGLHVVFWSGGKDSFLSLLRLQKACESQGTTARHIVLLTTFDPEKDMVTEQEIDLPEIMGQAKQLKRDLMVVPLPASCPNTLYIETIELALTDLQREFNVDKSSLDLVFGDLHLEDIKQWREGMFKDYEMQFPVFGASYTDLADELFTNELLDHVEISNVTVDTPLLKKASPFDHNLFLTLLLQKETHGIDAFGELGEFHTKVVFKDN